MSKDGQHARQAMEPDNRIRQSRRYVLQADTTFGPSVDHWAAQSIIEPVSGESLHFFRVSVIESTIHHSKANMCVSIERISTGPLLSERKEAVVYSMLFQDFKIQSRFRTVRS